jgi:microcystin-dependent protein
MTAMSPLRGVLNDTPANAIDVDWNFQTVEDYIANDVITRDGSTAMEAPLNLLGPPPSLATHAVTKGYVDANIIPIATIWQYAGSVAPPGWEFCNGAEHSSTDPTWVPLFNLIGFSYGQNGTNFKLPDLMGRTAVGRYVADSAHSDQGAVALFGTLGQQGGSRNTPLNSHTHAEGAHTHSINHNHGVVGSHGQNASHTHDIGHTHAAVLTDGAGDHAHSYPVINTTAAGTNVPQGSNGVGNSANAATLVGGWHAHNVPAIGFAGGSGAASGDHVHNVPIPDFGGQSGAAGGAGAAAGAGDGTNGNVPPYIAINFIIRVR